MNAHYFELWLRAFAFTQVVEIPVYMKLLRVKWHVAFGASALTHPIVWFVIFRSHLVHDEMRFGVAELFAFVAEAIYFAAIAKDAQLGKFFAASFFANAASVFVGEISRSLFGIP